MTAKQRTKKLLVGFTRTGIAVTKAAKAEGHIAPAKGPRGLKRRAKKQRKIANARRLQRVVWCGVGEDAKREAA